MSDEDVKWLHIDEQTDVLTSLLGCSLMLRQINASPAFWKHVVLGMHNALQGAMVCHLSGTAQLGALRETSVKEALLWHGRDRSRHNSGQESEDNVPVDPYPKQFLADAKVLFERLRHEDKRCEAAGSTLEISGSQATAFKTLHGLRNDFSHFSPKGWSIELSGLPHICSEILCVIKLIDEDGWAFRHLEGSDRIQMRAIIDDLEDNLNGRPRL